MVHMDTNTVTIPAATEKQVAYINKLCADRQLDAPDTSALTRRSASKLIDALRATPLPAKPVAPIAAPVPDGYYAIDGTGSQPVDFYRVNTPTSGWWSGYTFVSQVVGGQGDHPVRDRNRRANIIRSIQKATPSAAAERYGQEIGRCGICNRTLTDETSRAIGVGPDCRSGKATVGWYAAAAA